jgi:hypothetical protein
MGIFFAGSFGMVGVRIAFLTRLHSVSVNMQGVTDLGKCTVQYMYKKGVLRDGSVGHGWDSCLWTIPLLGFKSQLLIAKRCKYKQTASSDI